MKRQTNILLMSGWELIEWQRRRMGQGTRKQRNISIKAKPAKTGGKGGTK